MSLGKKVIKELAEAARAQKASAAHMEDAAASLAKTAKAAESAKTAKAADGVTDAAKAGNAAGDATTATAKTADGTKGGFLDWAKNNKGKTALGAAGLGAAGLVGYGALTSDDDGGGTPSYAPILTAPGGGLIGSAKDAVGLGDSATGGIVQMDPDVVRGLAAALRTQADNAAALVTSTPDAFTTYRAWLARDLLGAPTRDGKASPIVADFDAALVDAEKRYIEVAQGLSQQFEGDAVKLERLATEWEEMEATNKASIDAIDSSVQSPTSATPTPITIA